MGLGSEGAGQQPAWPGGGYGYVWNIPQWYPHTSMALFAPAAGFHPLQYAGQQLPNFQQQPQQVQSIAATDCPCYTIHVHKHWGPRSNMYCMCSPIIACLILPPRIC